MNSGERIRKRRKDVRNAHCFLLVVRVELVETICTLQSRPTTFTRAT
jgi:hypothetical protein